ncbi:MAG: tetratricopeptide repeat protein, partial [Rickettsia sp.]
MKTKTLLIIMIGVGFLIGYMVGASMDPIDRAIRKAQKLNRTNLAGVSSLREGGSWNLFGIFQKPKSLQEKVQTDLGFSNQYVARISNTILKKEAAVNTLEEAKEFIALAKQEVFLDNSLQTYLVSLGKIQLENGMVFQAITNLQKSYEINPYNSSTAYLLAMSYLGLYQVLPEGSDKSQAGENAVRFLKLSLVTQPNNMNITYGLALIYTDQGLYADAQALFLQMLDKNPENIDSLLGLARIYYDQGDVDRARRL